MGMRQLGAPVKHETSRDPSALLGTPSWTCRCLSGAATTVMAKARGPGPAASSRTGTAGSRVGARCCARSLGRRPPVAVPRVGAPSPPPGASTAAPPTGNGTPVPRPQVDCKGDGCNYIIVVCCTRVFEHEYKTIFISWLFISHGLGHTVVVRNLTSQCQVAVSSPPAPPIFFARADGRSLSLTHPPFSPHSTCVPDTHSPSLHVRVHCVGRLALAIMPFRPSLATSPRPASQPISPCLPSPTLTNMRLSPPMACATVPVISSCSARRVRCACHAMVRWCPHS